MGRRRGRMATLESQAMGVALVIATLLPALQGELDPQSGALEGNLGVLEDLGAFSLRGCVARFADRLRAGKSLPAGDAALREETRGTGFWPVPRGTHQQLAT